MKLEGLCIIHFLPQICTCFKETVQKHAEAANSKVAGRMLRCIESAYRRSVVPGNEHDGGVTEHIGQGEVH